MAEQSVTLEPNESQVITFEATPHEAKTYSVSVDGLTGTFRAEAPVEVIDFDLTKPTVTPAEVAPGTAITITCPVTSACTKPQTIMAKVIIYEGSILPGHGAVIATKASPSFSISPGEAYNVIVHHTAVAGTIDRRDIEVEIYIAGSLVKQSEWDDVYYVEKPALPEIIVDFDALSVLDVEGVEFTSVGEETVPNWGALAGALAKFGPVQYGEGYIVPAGAVTLANCIIAKGPSAAALYQCGIEHPECLTSLAKSYPLPTTGWTDTRTFPERFGVVPAVCVTVPLAGGAANLHVTRLGEVIGVPCCWYTVTWVQTYWQQVYASIWDFCLREIAPFTGLVATLAEPIEMSKIRGVSLRWLNKTIPIYTDCGTIWILQYRPAFSAEMPPPGFRLISLGPQAVGEVRAAPIIGCYAGGYYYPGIYDGIITVEAGCGYRDGTFTSYAGGGRFMIKNLARVTGTGTVVPPGY